MTKIPVKYLCSDRATAQVGTNVVQASLIWIDVYKEGSSTPVCVIKNGVRQMIIDQKRFSLAGCNLPDDKYRIVAYDPQHGGKNMLGLYMSRTFGGDVTITRRPKTDPVYEKQPWKLETKFMGTTTTEAPFIVFSKNRSGTSGLDDCDKNASPLIVDMYDGLRRNGTVPLTSPRNGISFDILGANSQPAPYSPKRISWIRSSRFQFIVLPNSKGEVRGIDEMFGDNTMGPDKKFAENGYLALAKYDGTDASGLRRLEAADRKIDKKDKVYDRLYLWADHNLDGKSTWSELTRLEDAGIMEVDLNYSEDYQEKDRFGNETKYKSVIKMKDGSMRLLFDIWFRYF